MAAFKKKDVGNQGRSSGENRIWGCKTKIKERSANVLAENKKEKKKEIKKKREILLGVEFC